MPSTLARLNTLRRVVAAYGLREFLDGRPRKSGTPRAVRLRRALEELGPVYIKLGQALSTRPDIVPPDIAGELTKLQDRVPPFASDVARREIETALGKPIAEVYARFDDTPLASASIAQVHAAQLKNADGTPGPEVVVKVLRPGIEKTIREDLAVMALAARLAERFSPLARRVRPSETVAEYAMVVLDELDLMREAANCAQLRRNWLGSPLIYHPDVYWEATRPAVMTQERLYGISIRELDRLREMGVSFQALAEKGVEIFFKQTFRDNFFHADMHPGNIFVDASNPADPKYLALDFGIVGTLADDDRRYLAENFLAFFHRDYRRVAELHIESGWIPPETRVEQFEAAIRTISEPIFGRPIKDISFGFFLVRLFAVARRFDYRVQPQLVLLQKTLLQVEGLGRQLYPELDLWKTAKPVMEEWMRAQLGPKALQQALTERLPTLVRLLPLAIDAAGRTLDAGGPGGVVARARLAETVAKAEDSARRLRRTLLAVALGGAAAVLVTGMVIAPWLAAAMGVVAVGLAASGW